MNPSDIDRSAPVIVKRDRVIGAQIDPLWALHIGIAQWPAWQKDIVTASIDGSPVVGKSFTWSTAGLDTPVVSTIYAIEPQRATLWGGPSAGIVGVHSWLFESTATGTRVTTEESWSGTAVAASPSKAAMTLGASLERWLDFLAAAATF